MAEIENAGEMVGVEDDTTVEDETETGNANMDINQTIRFCEYLRLKSSIDKIFTNLFRDGRGRPVWLDKYGPPTRTNYRVTVENLSSRVSWQVSLILLLLSSLKLSKHI